MALVILFGVSLVQFSYDLLSSLLHSFLFFCHIPYKDFIPCGMRHVQNSRFEGGEESMAECGKHVLVE